MQTAIAGTVSLTVGFARATELCGRNADGTDAFSE
jgi:hypothetical protein